MKIVKRTCCLRLVALALLAFISACGLGSHRVPGVGLEGRYLEGKDQFLRGRGGDMDRAASALEAVVRERPTYKDSLTLLSRAYYRKERYEDSFLIVQRALALNPEDEVAWLVLGLTQMRLGQGEKGLESLKGGITLLSKVSVFGYRNYRDWDSKGLVRTSIRRTVLLATKGLEEKENLVRSTEALLTRLDEEENFQRVDSMQERRRAL